MKKGSAMEGFIREDGTIRPIEHYDDTELRGKIQTNTDNISNLDSRVTELEEHGGVEDQTKADKVSGATAGNLASLDEEGNLQDSGKKPADFAPASGSTEYASADHTHEGVYSPVDHNHNSAYARANHTHEPNTVNGLSDFIKNATDRLEAIEGQQTTSWTTLATIEWPNKKYDNDSLYNFDEVEQLKVGQKIRLVNHNTPTTVAVECSVIYTGGTPYRAATNADLSSISPSNYDLQVASFSSNL